MRRREFIAGSCAGVAALPLAAPAQQPARVYRIAILSGASLSAPANVEFRKAFVDALRATGAPTRPRVLEIGETFLFGR